MGFRVKISLPQNNETYRKYLIYVPDSCKTITDVEDHIQSLFMLQKVELEVDDCLLPSDESVHVLEPYDSVLVRVKSLEATEAPKLVSTQEIKPKTLRTIKSELNSVGALLSRIGPKAIDGSQSMSVDDGDFVDSGSINSGTEGFFSVPRKKRKRVRKRKSHSQEPQVETPTFEPPSVNENKHIRFPSDNSETVEMESAESEKEVQSSSTESTCSGASSTLSSLTNGMKSNGIGNRTSPTPDWAQNLMNLKRSKITFARKTPQDSVELSTSPTQISRLKHSEEYPTIETPSPGSVILFNKLKIGENYCPTLSNLILGKVVDFNLSTKDVKFEILDGLDELRLADGKLSYADEINNECHLNWNEVLTPRLVS